MIDLSRVRTAAAVNRAAWWTQQERERDMIRNMTTALKAEDELRGSIKGMSRRKAVEHLNDLQVMAAEKAQYEFARAALVLRQELENER